MNNARLRQWLERLDSHAPGEAAHGERVAVYATATAHAMNWDEHRLDHLRFAAALHDIGKLDVPAHLLAQGDRPSGADVLLLRGHVEAGGDLLEPELDAECCEWVLAHHERWDGLGYPFGLVGSDIPLGARIIAVAETFDVLVNQTSWRPPITEQAAIDELRRCAGTQFDPEVVEAFLRVQPLIQPIEVESHA